MRTKKKDFTPKRGRPTQDQAAAIDEAILSAARKLFLDTGYADTTMELVAGRAGVSKGTLYARYSGKPQLWRAVVAEFHKIWRKRNLPELELEGQDVAETLRRYGLALVRALRQPDVFAFERMIAAESGRFPEVALEFHQQGHLASVNRLSRALVDASKHSARPLEETADAASIFTSCLIGWTRTVADRKQATDDECEAYVNKVVEIFMVGTEGWS